MNSVDILFDWFLCGGATKAHTNTHKHTRLIPFHSVAPLIAYSLQYVFQAAETSQSSAEKDVTDLFFAASDLPPPFLWAISARVVIFEIVPLIDDKRD